MTKNFSNQFYDKAWQSWGDMIKYSPAPRHRRRMIIKLLDQVSFETILDVGCGSGVMLDVLQKKYNIKISGMDISENIINKNKTYFPDMNFYNADISDTIIPKKFDCVIASEVLEHIVDYKTALINLTKMADKYIIITVPSCPLFPTDKNVGHIRHFNKNGLVELKEILSNENFKLVKANRWGYPFFNIYKHLINGFGSKRIQKSFIDQNKYGLSQKIISEFLYQLFFLNLNNTSKGYQLIILAEKEG